ncbi:hypothetical protein ACK3TF_000077 [Chlorella vulgaris]
MAEHEPAHRQDAPAESLQAQQQPAAAPSGQHEVAAPAPSQQTTTGLQPPAEQGALPTPEPAGVEPAALSAGAEAAALSAALEASATSEPRVGPDAWAAARRQWRRKRRAADGAADLLHSRMASAACLDADDILGSSEPYHSPIPLKELIVVLLESWIDSGML